MKISLFSSWNTQCGIADYSFHLKRSLEKHGLEVEVIPAEKNKSFRNFIRIAKKMNNANIAHIQHEYAFFQNNITRLIIHGNLISFFIGALKYYFFVKQIRIPVIVTLHGIFLPKKAITYQLIKFAHRLMLSCGTKNIVHRYAHLEELASIGIAVNKITVIPHPISEAKTIDSNTVYFNRCSWVQNDTDRILAIFGFIVESKGYEIALQAIKDIDNCILLIAGDKHPYDRSNYIYKLKNKIKILGLERKVRITGYVLERDMPNLMKTVNIVLAPYTHMSASGSLRIAISYRKPIIASDISPMKEMCDEGFSMLLFRSGDSHDLKVNILRLLDDINLQRSLSESSIRYASEYSYDNIVKKYYLSLYKDIADNS